MSIGSCRRSTPGATSVTSSEAGSCSCFIGLVIATTVLGLCNFTPARAGPRRPASSGPTLARTVSVVSLALFAVGWSCGWVLLWRLPLPPRPPSRATRRSLAIVVPARDEAHNLPTLLASVLPQLAPGDELVVVDDHSADATAAVARDAGATVVAAPDLPDGWAGKPWACHARCGRHHRRGAGVRRRRRVARAPPRSTGWTRGPSREPARWSSVQPWHRVERPYEALSLLFNVTALMGGGGFSVLRGHVPPAPRLRTGAGDRPRRPTRRPAATPIPRSAVRWPRTSRWRALLGTQPGLRRSRPGRRSGCTRRGARPGAGLDEEHRHRRPQRPVVGGTAHGRLDLVARRRTVRLVVVLRGERRPAGGARLDGSAASGCSARRVYPVLLVFFLVVFARSVVLTALGRPVWWRGRRVATRSGR